jgi:glycine/D-amino acid oxidase-like deaminating enzyme
MTADYLIVGQGIAGSVLAWTLHRRGHRILIINDPNLPSASQVSGGIFNPLTGKKLNRTWKADEIFPFSRDFYDEMQQSLACKLLHFCNIYRPFRSIEEQNSYLAQTADPNSGKYVLNNADNEKFAPFIENPFGGLQITQSGWLDCPEMLQKVRTFFLSKNQYIEDRFNGQLIDYQDDVIFYNKIEVKKILFCEGFEACQNSFFEWLPFNPVKGQTLIAQVEDYPLTEIINQGTFILPIDNQGRCRFGATYSWDDLDWNTTEDAREFLEEKIKLYLKKPYHLIEQQAGIRPSTHDRRPFIGLHPEYPSFGIFNGLGTKGVTLAPFFAEQFAKFLESGEDLDAEVNIERFFSLYFRSKES